MLCPKRPRVSADNAAHKPSPGDVLGCPPTNHAYTSHGRDDGEACPPLLSSTRRARAIPAPDGRWAALGRHRPARETAVPGVALAPGVRVVPRAHGVSTGEASGRGRTTLPQRRCAWCTTRAWTGSMGCILPAAPSQLWLRRPTTWLHTRVTTRGPHPLFHRKPGSALWGGCQRQVAPSSVCR